MAVYPDRIVLKNSTDGPAAVITAIESGGTDEIQQGEIVLSREPGKVEIYTVDSAGNIVAVKGVETLDGLTDVTITSPTTNDYLRYNGSQWVNVTSTFYDVAQDGGDFDTGTTDLTQTIFDWFDIPIDAHSDVDTTTAAPSVNQTLLWDGTNWVPGDVTLGASAFIVAATAPTTREDSSPLQEGDQWWDTDDANLYVYYQSAWVQTSGGSGGGATVLDDLTDVDTTTVAPTDGQVLTWDNANSKWEPADATGGATTLVDLTDTNITSPTTGEYLRYSSGTWRDLALDISDDPFPNLGNDLTLSGYAITDSQGLNIKLQPIQGAVEIFGHVSGHVGKLKINCEANTHGVTIQSPPHSAGATYTLTLPTSAGSANQVLTTDGAGVLSWTTASGGGGGALNDLSDVTITAAATGEVLRYNGSAWVDAQLAYSDLTGTPTLVTDLDGLSDVTITAAATGEVLRYNGSAWVDAQLDYADLSGTPTNLSQFTNDVNFITDITGEVLGDLSNVVIGSATNGDVLSFNGTNWVNSAAPPADISGSSIGQLNDVDTTTSPPSNGEGLIWNSVSGNWEPGTVSSGPIALNDLTDVTITSAATGEVLRYNGSSWVDATLDYSDLSGTPSLATVATSGDYNDLINQPTIPANVGDLGDVTITSPANGQILEYNGSSWVNVANSGGGGATSIDDLTDVDTTTAAPSLGQVLKWDGANWIPGNDNTGGGGSATLGRGDGGDLDFGTVDSAFVFAVYGGGDLDTTAEDKPVEFVSYDVDGGELT